MNHLAQQLLGLLDLRQVPLAVSFVDEPPAGVPRIDAAAPSGCSYWKLAADGRVFYTAASDHFGCPVGAHTHGVELPATQQAELTGLMTTMIELGYLRESEIAGIPRRTAPFRYAVYAPWDLSPCEPDVILVRGNTRQVMLLTEAARAAGVGDTGQLMGRPTYSMIPAVMDAGQVAASLGCIGNRVYTGLGDDELFAAIPGPRAAQVIRQLHTILNANRQLEAYHRQRAS